MKLKVSFDNQKLSVFVALYEGACNAINNNIDEIADCVIEDMSNDFISIAAYSTLKPTTPLLKISGQFVVDNIKGSPTCGNFVLEAAIISEKYNDNNGQLLDDIGNHMISKLHNAKVYKETLVYEELTK